MDDSFVISDAAALHMCQFLLKHEGIFVGPSSALNVCTAYLTAIKYGPGQTIVTMLCDGGAKYMSKAYSDSWLEANNFHIKLEGNEPKEIVNNFLKEDFLHNGIQI